MTIGFIGLFRSLITRQYRAIHYLADSSYWLYLSHLPLVILAQLCVRDWPQPAIVKFLLVCGVTTGVLLAIYHLLVRHSWLGTLLNGPRVDPVTELAELERPLTSYSLKP